MIVFFPFPPPDPVVVLFSSLQLLPSIQLPDRQIAIPNSNSRMPPIRSPKGKAADTAGTGQSTGPAARPRKRQVGALLITLIDMTTDNVLVV